MTSKGEGNSAFFKLAVELKKAGIFAGTAGCSACRAHSLAPTLVACGDGMAFGAEIIAGVLQIINRTPAMIADLTFNKWPA